MFFYAGIIATMLTGAAVLLTNIGVVACVAVIAIAQVSANYINFGI